MRVPKSPERTRPKKNETQTLPGSKEAIGNHLQRNSVKEKYKDKRQTKPSQKDLQTVTTTPTTCQVNQTSATKRVVGKEYTVSKDSRNTKQDIIQENWDDDQEEQKDEGVWLSENNEETVSGCPELIKKMLELCKQDTDKIKCALAGRLRAFYRTVFQKHKEKLSARDRAIISSGLVYIYDFSRMNSIPKENAEWLIGIHEIPVSHIISYTNKEILKQIAKEYGISCSNKKAEDLVVDLREATEKY